MKNQSSLTIRNDLGEVLEHYRDFQVASLLWGCVSESGSRKSNDGYHNIPNGPQVAAGRNTDPIPITLRSLMLYRDRADVVCGFFAHDMLELVQSKRGYSCCRRGFQKDIFFRII